MRDRSYIFFIAALDLPNTYSTPSRCLKATKQNQNQDRFVLLQGCQCSKTLYPASVNVVLDI